MTKFFTITTFDLFNNLEPVSYNKTDVVIFVKYIDHDQYLSLINVVDLAEWAFVYGQDVSGIAIDNNDGTYSSQFTIFRAGRFAVFVMINGVNVIKSPYELPESDYLYVTPADIYAPNCIVKNVVLAYTAGTLSSFNV